MKWDLKADSMGLIVTYSASDPWQEQTSLTSTVFKLETDEKMISAVSLQK